MTDHIPAEAVEAAAEVLYEHGWKGSRTWARDAENRDGYRGRARDVLSAALPFMRPEPSEDEREVLGAIRTAQAQAMTEGDHVLADQLDAAAHYVIVTRRPMPSREQVAKALSEAFDWTDCTWEQLLPEADAVLALFKGADRG